jgi:hypothetical protein
MVVLAATGRELDQEDCRVLDDVIAVLTVADPRIYPLKLVRLASAYGEPIAGLAAAFAMLEGAVVGPVIAQEAAAWLSAAARDLGSAISDRAAILTFVESLLARRSRLAGFGVPFRNEDERRSALAARIAARGRAGGCHWKLQEVLADVVLEARGIPANVGLSVAALSLDLGLRAGDLAALYTGLTTNVFLANAVEGAKQAPAMLRCLPEEFVEYVGVEPRRTPHPDG